MKMKFFFLTIIFILSLASEISAQSKINTKIEAGLINANMKGDIKNLISTSDFTEDLGYSKFNASYFSVEAVHTYDYFPNVYIGFFNTKESSSTTLDKTIEIADFTYSSSNISSSIDYNVLNLLLYENFLIKGSSKTSLYGSRFYPGDLEFRLGINIKYINWKYNIIDKTAFSSKSSWIKVNEFIPLPYLGFRYYRYKFSMYGNISALSFMDAKSISAEAGIDYRFVKGLHLSLGYIYEDFDVVEDNDTVYYQIDGIKLGFKYIF